MGMCKRLVHPDTGLVEARVVDGVVLHREGGITAMGSHRGAVRLAEAVHRGCRVEEDSAAPLFPAAREAMPIGEALWLLGEEVGASVYVAARLTPGPAVWIGVERSRAAAQLRLAAEAGAKVCYATWDDKGKSLYVGAGG